MFTKFQKGASLVEYVLIVAVISLIAIAGANVVAPAVQGTFDDTATALNQGDNTD